MDDLRKMLEEKLKAEQRGVKWFWENYIQSPVNPGYATTYHQIKGFINTMPDVLVDAIQKYLKSK